MTDDDKALVERLRDFVIAEDIDLAADRIEALSAENEQHEAFRQEVSDAAEHLCTFYGVPIVMDKLGRFIITKPDPLVEAMIECGFGDSSNAADDIRAALAKRGLEIREKSDDE